MPNAKLSQLLWSQIVADYRRACFLRRQGHEEEARGIINGKLPDTVARWSREDDRPEADKQVALQTMFSTEQFEVDSLLLTHKALTEKLTETLIPVIRQQVSEEVCATLEHYTANSSHWPPVGSRPSLPTLNRRERVRFDDIPAVIDKIIVEQSQDYGAHCVPAYS